MLWYTSQDKTQIALVNGGGIRASIKAGDISYSQVLETLPFGNRLVQFDATGADVIAALENGISDMKDDPEASGGRFLQVGGIKFTADLKKPVGARIGEVTVGSKELGFQPLNKATVYRVVALDFMYNGGDGYTMLKNGKNLRGGDVPLEMMLIDYIKAHQPVSPELEGRIKLTR
jgi:5'-nucleotidase